MARAGERTYKVYKSDYNYTGIQATLIVPKNPSVLVNNNDYLIWYVGFTDSANRMVEAGISYTAKYTNAPHYRKILNGTGFEQYSQPMTTSLTAGSQVNIKLINNGDQTASLYIAGNLVTTQKCPNLNKLTQVKLIHGTEGSVCRYTEAQFKKDSVQYRKSDGTWVVWTNSNGYTIARDTGTSVSPIAYTSELNPMVTSAN